MGVPEISVQQLAERLKAGEKPFLLDVRQPFEAQLATLPDSVLIPLNRLGAELESLRARVPEGAQMVVYCHHGGRSHAATQGLLANGFTDVVNLAGGIDAWSLLVDPTVPRY
ncbi:MAG: rhodanese-like domain-containing protein [Gemmataceae bacterium]